MRYLTLFRLEIVHGYYTDQRCFDLQVEATPDTQKLLRGHRCVLKHFPNGLRVLIAATDENAAFISLPKVQTFAFRLRLLNPDFGLFTDLTEFDQLAAPLYTNEPPASHGDLVPVSRGNWSTEQFVVQKPSSREVFALRGQPVKSPDTAEGLIVDGLGEKAKRGRYDENTMTVAVNSSKVKAGTPFTVTYPVPARLERNVFAAVEIKYSPGKASLLENDNSFRITFKPKKARWKYYIVTDKSNGQTVLPALEDKDKVVLFPAADRMDLAQGGDPEDEVVLKLAKQYPTRQCFRFISSNLVPCQQAARKNIQFRLNGDSVLNSLPNPPLQNYCIDVTNATREHALYEVIRYFIQ